MMLLKAFHAYAEAEELISSIELTKRVIHLVIRLRKDGSVDPAGAWESLSTTGIDAKGKTLITPGRSFSLPAFPGVNAGGKANFLADDVAKVLGIDPTSGEPLPDDAATNAAKSFRHFWQRISEARTATGSESLRALLEFREHHLRDPETRRSIPGIVVTPFGKKDPKPTLCAETDAGPVPLEKRIVTFSIDGQPLFSQGRPLHDYWKGAFARERFGDSSNGPAANLGVCLVTGQEDQPIAESHRTPIKGVPGLPPIGGYLVSFDDATPSLRSYGLEKAFQAPVSESAAAAYALGLNHILSRKDYARRINDFVLCSWVHEDPDMSIQINGIVLLPMDDAVHKFHEAVDQGRRFGGWSEKHFRSVTLASNGGRVVVRRWLDESLLEAARNVEAWLDDLKLDEIQPPPPEARAGRSRQPSTAGTLAQAEAKAGRPYRSIDALAWATARTPSEVRSEVYDALYRAAYEGDCPEALLPAVLRRLRVEAVESGSNLRYHANRFALIKLILKRAENMPTSVEPQLCDTHDSPYNCGRLLAVLDDIQYRAHKKGVGADVIARYYGNASTFPANVLPRLLKLSNAHISKLQKGDKKDQAAGRSLERKLNSILALFRGGGAENVPEFPGLLDIRQQGRFALGFYQQKAHDQRRLDALRAAKVAQAMNSK